MKRSIVLLLVLFLLAAGCQPVGTATPVPATSTPASGPLSAPWDDRSLFAAGLVRSSRPVLATLKGASVYHLEYRIDSDLIHVTGREEVRYTNQENAPLTDVRFRLFPNILGGELHVPEVSIDGTPVTPGRRGGRSRPPRRRAGTSRRSASARSAARPSAPRCSAWCRSRSCRRRGRSGGLKPLSR